MRLLDTVASVRSFVRKTQAKALILGGGVCTLLSVLGSSREGIGFLGGVVVSAVNFQLMFADAMEMTGKSSRKAGRFVAGRCLLRYLIMGGYLAVIAAGTDLNIFAAFAGLLSIQAVLLCEAVFVSGVIPGGRRG